MIIRFINFLGRSAINTCTITGEFTLFLLEAIKIFLTSKLKLAKTFAQIDRIGVESLSIVILTGLFTGMVLALQTYIGFQRVGGEQFIGAIVALGLIRELGPVLTALMVTGRAGSAITANAQQKGKPEDTEYWSTVPAVVTPGQKMGEAPSDAIILFDGKNLDE